MADTVVLVTAFGIKTVDPGLYLFPLIVFFL
jgi:hypothetical protein